MAGKRRDGTKTIHKIKQNDALKVIDDLSVQIYCESASCPNRCRCINQGLATFQIMGEICTRRCNSICISKQGKPLPLDENEPRNVGLAVKALGLTHIVLTSVTRDDLKDAGAEHIAKTVTSIHEINPGAVVEVIVHNAPGNDDTIKVIVESSPEVISHDIKTVPRLYPEIFAEAAYPQSLRFLEMVKKINPSIVTKSGMMLGLGENDYEVIKVLSDVRDGGCNCLTLGQYMPPSTSHYQFNRYVTPQEFAEYKCLSLQMGYSSVRSGSFVRTSFDAPEMYKEIAE
jgi:lipoyl synthase